MDFTIEDVPFDPAEQLPAAVDRALKVIEELPYGKLLPSAAIAKRVGITAGSWHQHSNHPALAPYKQIRYVKKFRTNINVYGNKETIEALKNE